MTVAPAADRNAVVVQRAENQLDAGVQGGGYLGRTPLPFLIQLGDQDRVELLTVFPGGSWLDWDLRVLQPCPDHLL